MTMSIEFLITAMPQIIFSILAIERETMNHNNINQIILKTTDSFSIKTIFQDWQAECWYLENGHNCVLTTKWYIWLIGIPYRIQH